MSSELGFGFSRNAFSSATRTPASIEVRFLRRFPRLLSRPTSQEPLVDTVADGELELKPATSLVSLPFALTLRSACTKPFEVLELTP